MLSQAVLIDFFFFLTFALSDILQGFIKKANNQPGVVRQSQVTADYVLQQTSRWLFGELQDHFALKDRKTQSAIKTCCVQFIELK